MVCEGTRCKEKGRAHARPPDATALARRGESVHRAGLGAPGYAPPSILPKSDLGHVLLVRCRGLLPKQLKACVRKFYGPLAWPRWC